MNNITHGRRLGNPAFNVRSYMINNLLAEFEKSSINSYYEEVYTDNALHYHEDRFHMHYITNCFHFKLIPHLFSVCFRLNVVSEAERALKFNFSGAIKSK